MYFKSHHIVSISLLRGPHLVQITHCFRSSACLQACRMHSLMQTHSNIKTHTMYIRRKTCVHKFNAHIQHTHLNAYIHTSMHKYKHTVTYIQTYIHTCIHAYIQTYIHTYIRTYIQTDIHTQIHTSGGRYVSMHESMSTTANLNAATVRKQHVDLQHHKYITSPHRTPVGHNFL